MKKTLLLLIILANSSLLMACDICGCGAGNSYIGILPDFSKRIVGLRYRYNSMLSHVGVNGTQTYLTTAEKYNTAELWAGWNIKPNLRVMMNIPYNFNQRQNNGSTSNKNGIGDISAAAFYRVFDKRKTVSSNKLLVQTLWIGAGIKAPTGHYDPSDKSESGQSANLFQSGTGSTDFSFSAMYDIRLQDVGLNLNSSYKINTANKYDYAYGNKLNTGAQLYYKLRVKNKYTVAPNGGLQFETARKDLDKGLIADISGGNLLMGTLGLETAIGRMAIGGNFQTPFSQNLANGIVKAGNRVMVHVSVML